MKRQWNRILALLMVLACLLGGSGCSSMPAWVRDLLPEDVRNQIPLESGELLPDDGVPRYGRTLLDEEGQYVYDQLVRGIRRTEPSQAIDLSGAKSLTQEELNRAVELFSADHPECFWFAKSYSYASKGDRIVRIFPDYYLTGDELTAARAELDAAVDAIVEAAPKDATAIELALYYHDAVAHAVTYEKVGYHQTAYGALVENKAVCAGYAAAYQLLMHRAGFQALTVIGTSVDRVAEASSAGGAEESVLHAWNVIWLANGYCFYTDVTWDDSAADAHTFHYYFNLSLDEMAADHHVDESIFTLPACSHTGYDYFDTLALGSLSDTSSIDTIVQTFRLVEPGVYEANFRFESDRNAFEWFKARDSKILAGLAPHAKSCSYSVRSMAGEVLIRLEITE